MKKNNVMIYLKKANYDKYEELAKALNMPISSLLADFLQESTAIATLDEMIKMSRVILSRRFEDDR